MDGKSIVICCFVTMGLFFGFIKNDSTHASLWMWQVAFLLTANLMMLEYAWKSQNRPLRLFVIPIIGICGITGLTILELRG